MAYATIDDVQRRMPQFTLNPSTKPSVESAQTFLDDTHAMFDAAMDNLGYVVPITGPKSISQSREIVCQCTIAKILYARGAALGTDAAFQSADRAQKQCDAALKALADPNDPRELVDAGRTDDMIAKPGGGGPEGSYFKPRVHMTDKF